jgi:hypothetical protein
VYGPDRRSRNLPGSLGHRVFNGTTTPLALILAGAWLSNIPLGVMASYLLAAVALAVGFLFRSWAPILRAAIAATLGIGLSAIYLAPAMWEQRWIDIRQATEDPGEMIENSFLFGHHAESLLQVHNAELRRVSWIAVFMVVVAVIGILVASRRRSLLADRRFWIPLALIPFAVLLLQFPISLPVWNLLPKLRFLQFPWRWLVVLEAPMAIFFVAAAWPRAAARRWPRMAVSIICSALFLASTAIAAFAFFQPCDDEDAVAPMVQVYRTGAGFEGTDEYAPVDTDNSIVATGLPDACLVTDPNTTLGVLDTPGANPDWWVEQHSCDATFASSLSAAHVPDGHLRIRAVLPHPGYLILRLRTYPAWRITLNGNPAGPLAQRDDGLIDLPVPQGPIDLTVDWITTPDIVAGRWLTVLSLLVLATLYGMERRIKLSSRRGLS